ncbi:MAG: LysM peptidoglycan-binding domain-containing protein [Bacteroidetes bacterium]|nr:LysM peptidoglycan-binding domain-containing protein [Bacteroidota bacterium]HET6244668.1 LysM peptidoglycan-binding domain-containing protein [Bacteroidia bacterium]
MLLLFAASIPSVFSQDDLKTETIEGKKYYMHKVEQGHTLYAISKKYLIEIEDILNENPEASEGLKIDQVLRIPLVKENKKLHKLNNPEIKGNYILHTIEKGQTLYSLSKFYNIALEDIVFENPGVQNEMRIGDVLKIRVNKVENINKESIAPAKEDGWLRHTIHKGETLYSLAKKYGVNIDSISIINNGLPEGLKDGETIRIPVKILPGRNDIIKADTSVIYKYIKEKLKSGKFDEDEQNPGEYNIALLLPLFIQENDGIEKNKRPFEKKILFDQSIVALQFYEGFLLALDSMNKEGLVANIYVYDTAKDSLQLKMVLAKPELKQMDLIIGPLFLSGFVQASKFALENEIHIVSPFIQQNSIIAENPYVSKVVPAPTTQFDQIAEFISEAYPNQNLVLIHNSKLEDKPIVRAFTKKAAAKNLSIKEINYLTSDFKAIQLALSSNKKNILIVPSNDVAFVTDLISKLYFSSTQEKEIIVFGSDSWLDFENLDINYLQKLNTHIATANHVDFDNEKIKNFIGVYREKYLSDPSNYAFQGFDLGYFYLSLLNKYGRYFSQKYVLFTHNGLQLTFNVSKVSEQSGFENKGFSIIRFENYKLVKVN